MDNAYREALRKIEVARETGATRLFLNKMKLKELPKEIGQLCYLGWLDLHDNQLVSLPAEICQLSSLQKLSLQNNQLTSLPAEICQLSSLHTLDLECNQLVNLPNEINLLSNLQELYLDYNKLIKLPAEIGQLSDLQELWLNNNKLTNLPNEIANLPNLHQNAGRWLGLRLKLHNNDFNIPEEVFDWEDPQKIIKYILDHQKAKESGADRSRSKQIPSPPPSVPPV